MKRLTLFVVFVIVAFFATAQQKYAVLICGDKPVEDTTYATATSGWGDPGDEIKNEFWNDTFLMWEMLVYEKGYNKENVYVLYYDGDDFTDPLLAHRYNAEVIHYENYPITNLSATKDNVEDVFTGLATGTGGYPQITQDDFLFVWTFGHGTPGEIPPEAAILLYGSAIDESEFADAVNPINAGKKVFWMQHSHARGFGKQLDGVKIYFDPMPLTGELPEE